MGSLTSTPRAPAPQVVYYAPAAPAPTPAPAPSDSGAGDSPSDPAQTPSQQREQNLLQRSRGIFGTVQTSFRGLLSQTNPSPRKSLLGE